MELMRIPIKLFEVRDKLPTISVIGCNGLRLVTPIQEYYKEKRLYYRCYYSERGEIYDQDTQSKL
jgi:hypothetical protein